MKYHADPIIDSAIARGASWEEILAIGREQQFQAMLVHGMLKETRGLVKFCIGVRFPTLPIPKALDSIDGFKTLQNILKAVITTTDAKAVFKAVKDKAKKQKAPPKRAH